MWKQDRVVTILQQLQQLGWIAVTTSNIAQCKSDLREQIVHHLHTTGEYKRFADVLFPLIGGRYFATGYGEGKSWTQPKMPEDYIREFRHVLLTGNSPYAVSEVLAYHENFLEEEMAAAFFHDTWNLLVGQHGVNWLREIKFEFRCRVLEYLLRRSICTLEFNLDEVWAILMETVCDLKCENTVQVLTLDYALCAGKLDDPTLSQHPGQLVSTLLAAHRAFACGRYDEAVGQYRLVLNVIARGRAAKNWVLPSLSGICHALAELNEGNRHALSELAKVAARLDTHNLPLAFAFPVSMSGCWNMIDSIAERLIGKPSVQLHINTTSHATTRPIWLSLLLSAYESAWFQLPPVHEVERSMAKLLRKADNGFPWLAAEFADVCEFFDIGKPFYQAIRKTVEKFRQQTKAVPLSALFAGKEDWALCLESLQTLASETPKTPKSKTVTKKEQPKSRLIWLMSKQTKFSPPVFIPCEQKWSAKTNSWLKEDQKTIAHLFKSQNRLNYLTEQDRTICSKIRVTRHDYKFNDEIALDFVGHPLLFTKTDAKNLVRVELVLAKPEIAMQEVDGKLHVSFVPPLTTYTHTYVSGGHYRTASDDSDTSFFVIEELPTRHKVVKLTKTEMQIRAILGAKGRVFPKKAQDQLAMLLGKFAVGGGMDVKTDAKVEFADIPTVPVDPKMYVYLSPNGEGIQADFFVRPLGAGSPNHRPGLGSERLLGVVDGQNVQTVRNLAEEKRLRTDIVAHVPAFQLGAAQSDDQYNFASPDDALALLAELKDAQQNENAALNFELYWPYGEKYSVSSTASFGNFNLAFSSLEDWLSASGTLTVDGEAFELPKLFELLNDNSDSRFIKLSDQKFLALTKEFRKRLGELKQLAQIKGKSVQLHPLAAVGMEDFFDAIPSLQKSVVWNDVKKRIEAAREYKAPFPKNFVGDPRDYQLEGYHWMSRNAKWGVGCCLADDMGLGKTIQALMLLLLHANAGPALVVAPTSVCFNWEREAAKFAPTLKIKRIQSITTGAGAAKKERDKLIASVKKREVLITSYTLLQQEIDLFAAQKYATVILDESQAIKNPESNRAKAAAKLQAEFRIAMTGTPIENRLTELWSLFRYLNPGLLGSLKSFEDRFAVPIQRDQSAIARNTLRRLVHPFILRRTKSQVLEELPARTEIVREIELFPAEATLYEAARLNALKELQEIRDKESGQSRLQILAALTRLRQLCCNPKMVLPDSQVASSKLETFREIMEELKENRHKVLVFSQFVKHLEILKAELDEMGISYQYLDGSTPERERQKRVDAFQSGESDAFLISIKAGGSGLNLTAADYVIHTDPWWNPAVEDQATDRAHRIGQTRPVTVYRLITQGTIEEKIVRLHHEKRDIADKLLEGTDQATKLSADELIEILRS